MRVILVGARADRERLRAQLAPGAFEIVGEAASLAEARTIRAAADALLLAPRNPGAPGDDDAVGVEALTARELQVLELLAEGLPNKAIAARLQISDQTVKFHVASIFGKLGAGNRTEAIRRAVRRGLIAL
jgi:DNA-binding NarL/FixJ family response regulator